jgi:uncharacterized protein DUF1963
MFEKKSDIAATLREVGLEPFTVSVERLCRPSICFVEPEQPGLTRFGGAPDLPDKAVWPVRPGYSNGRKLEEAGSNRAHLGSAFTSAAPLHFIAQIPLDAVARFGVLKERLPDNGRLLFFWDTRCGPWIDSAESCRVIWDRSPIDQLVSRDPPAELAVPDQHLASCFPLKSVAPLPVWSMPEQFMLEQLAERTGDHELLASLDDDDWADEWDSLYERRLSWRLTSGREVLPHRLCGWPFPEQDDPRVDAAVSAGGTKVIGRALTAAESKQRLNDMHDWTLLLQVDLNRLAPRTFAEGLVYFVMREADLAARNFDRVHAIYQQT